MKYDPAKHHRRSIRLPGYDYTTPGAYFVTICVQDRECLLGKIVDGEMELSDYGRITTETWQWLGDHHPFVSHDAWVVMPNHIHGIIMIEPDTPSGGPAAVGAVHEPPLRESLPQSPTHPGKRKPLGRLVAAFKTVSTNRINQVRGTPGLPFWQRNYYEHIIRDEADLDHIREYIVSNPQKWELDQLYPDNPSKW